MRLVDMTSDPRRGQYEYFRTFSNPYASMTVNCDITHLRQVTRERELPFFLTVLHCAVNAANAVPELRRRIRGESVLEYENCLSSHTVALPDETYCYCVLDCDRELSEFLPYAAAEVQRAKDAPALDDGDDPDRLFFVSSVPWVSFASISLPKPVPADSNPRITFGKYFAQGDRILLPVDLTVHHGLADGIHMAKFFEGFTRRAEEV